MENANGSLNLTGQELEDTINYISEGGGTAKLKSGKSVVYNSENEEKTVEVTEDDAISLEKKNFWEKITDILFR